MSKLEFNELMKNSIGDFFHLPANYPLRIAKYTNMHLRTQEGVKTRQVYGNLCSIVNGCAFSVPSHGASMVVCCFAARRLYVAMHKLRLIKQEMLDRGLELRPFLKRDWMIPVAVSLTSAAITWGVSFGLEGFVPTANLSLIPGANPANVYLLPTDGLSIATAGQPEQLAGHAVTHATTHMVVDQANLVAPTGRSTIHAVANHSGAAWSGFHEGFGAQVKMLLGGGFDSSMAINSTTSPAYAAELAGFHAGAHAAKQTEQALSAQLGALALQFTSDKIDFESLKRREVVSMSCRRLPWSTRVVCQECVLPILGGLFYHSCIGNDANDEDDDPDDDEYDVCVNCFQGIKDEQFKASLRPMYMAVPGDSFHPGLNAGTLVDLLGPKDLSCMKCNGYITYGWYYDCWACRSVDKRWTFCAPCYRSDGGCTRNKSHQIFAFPRTRMAKYTDMTPYQKQTAKKAKETGRARCSKCDANVERGAYFHCAKCDKGDYILCPTCHASEKHCGNSAHVLTKYYAWKYRRDSPVHASEWTCSNPDCLNREHEEVELGLGVVRTRSLGTQEEKEKEKGKKKRPSISSKFSFGSSRSSVLSSSSTLTIDSSGGGKMGFKFFFSCLDPACDGGKFGLCPACYFTDLTCPVKGHDMFKCFFK